MTSVNYQFILSMLIVVLGFFLKKIKLIDIKDGQSLARIIFNITLPSLILYTFSTIKLDSSLILVTVIVFLYGTLMTGAALFIFRKEPRKIRGMLSMLLPAFNVGLFAYPLVQSIWGPEGVKYFAMFELGNAIPLYALCYLIGSYFSTDEAKLDYNSVLKKLRKSIPLLACIVSITFNLAGLHLPNAVIDLAQIIEGANKPLALLLLGVYLDFNIDSEHLKSMIKLLGIRYAAGLTVGFALFFLLPLGELFRYTMLIGFILPIPSAILAYTVQYEYDEMYVGSITNLNTVISFLLIWCIIAFAK